MSSVGFTPQSNDHELEKLREAWRSLNDLLKNLTNHLQVAKWNVAQAKKAIAAVGELKNQKARQLK